MISKAAFISSSRRIALIGVNRIGLSHRPLQKHIDILSRLAQGLVCRPILWLTGK
jgi:hypothetical protein